MTLESLYIPALLGGGALILLVAWLPLVIRKLPLSLPIVCVAIGAAVALWPPVGALIPNPVEAPTAVEKLAELVVIVSLMGAGLKISRPFGFRCWQMTWRLLGIAMPLTIVVFALLGHTLLGFGWATALLLAAALAPTDPVLASDVQIEDPTTDQDDEARFALTSEAGLNDSAAFPFIHLAIALATAGATGAALTEWAIDAVAIRITVGLVAGVACGRLLGWVIYHVPGKTDLARTGDGFVALGGTLATYGATELLHGYGFVAVFVAGLTLRRMAEGHDFNQKLHDFADEFERLLMMVLLVGFGAMLTAAGLLGAIGWRDVVFAVVALLLVRPVVGWLALIGSGRPAGERAVVAIFGIRGLGSIYYLAYALNHAGFETPARLWGIVALVVLLSILVHGVTVTPAMRRLDRAFGRPAK
ncbi:cation:proton antiporter [Sphingomonas donggukensis]|uniref:Cation:proton antiporter n=1 Tax=Sphingomonas donggukensis TaxID=2949093 RepID=A0ABY4TV27_9SPHN|nr:cation:proton antiporter [Sphingomonas donggukensis]URW75730.1 cation:proton antiporter [Sphingomonas donggukensis]